MSKIVNVLAREVLDSRGDPTVEVEITTEKGNVARAIVPSGASTGEREALELRDHDEKRYLGKGVLKAVSNVNQVLKPYVIGKEVSNQKEIDDLLIHLDGTKDKSKYGANAILGISLAVSKASSLDQNLPYYDFLGKKESYLLPVPMMNVINGGSHADSSVDFQEYMIVPVGASSIREAIRMSSEVFHHLKKILKEDGHITSVGDEGGFAPNLSSNEEPFKYIMKAILDSGYIPGDDFVLAIDVAASEFYNKETKHYEFKKSHGGEKTTEEMISYLEELVEKYPIFSIEDGLGENDMEGWKELTKRLGNKIQLVGDDLFVTNPSIFKEGIQGCLANAILIKVNQVGTISETIETVKMAKSSGYHTIISHRSGETEDTSIAHLALALETGQIKTGSMSRTDRICKYNELIRIEEELKDHAIYAGKSILKKK